MSHFGALSETASGDFDSDGMTNLEEFTYGFDPTVADALDDADNDRYPNIFEIRNGTNPNSPTSTPTPTLVVDGAGGGTHTSMGAAFNALSLQTVDYVIIGVAPGVYSGANQNIGVRAYYKKILVIGLEGAAKTIFEGTAGVPSFGWELYETSVVSSLTFRKMTDRAIYATNQLSEFRFVDLLFCDNVTPYYPGGIYVNSASNVVIAGSTFLNNRGSMYSGDDIYFGATGSATVRNTVAWHTGTNPALVTSGSVTLAADHSLMKGQTMSGTGNLSGTTDPKLRFDGRLLAESPLRGAGGPSSQSRLDMDGELRPTSAPDIGVDEFLDADSDSLADVFELQSVGNLTTLISASSDGDSDGLTAQQEYENGTSPVVSDTDGDGISDGQEVTVQGTNPRLQDTDGDDMPDGWELSHGLSPTTPNALADSDGDRFSDAFEYAYGTDPTDRTSIPAPTIVLDGSGGGTHTNLSAAVAAASALGGKYVIVGIAPGVYTGAGNVAFDPSISTKSLLIIGLQGASKTIFENTSDFGWDLTRNTTIVSSLTFRKMARYPIYANNPASEFQFIDMLFEGNGPVDYYAGALTVYAASKTLVSGCTFVDNLGGYASHIYLGGTQSARLENSVLWSTGTATMLYANGGVTLSASHSLVKGQTLTGTGNLAATTDPKLRFDGHLLAESPLRGAGGGSTQSRLDMDGELRPATAPDIGVDQFVDSDSDLLADSFELQSTGNLTTLTSASSDGDSDGLNAQQEYANGTSPVMADTDGDGLTDGDEVTVHATNPRLSDSDNDDIPDGFEVAHGLSPTSPNALLDSDGDRYPDAFEYAYGSDPSDRMSVPTPTIVLDGAGGGTHTTLSSAVETASSLTGKYVIVGIAAGVFTGPGNVGFDPSISTKTLLLIGLQGASKTIFENSNGFGWNLTRNTTLVSSLTFRKMRDYAIYANNLASEFQFVDMLFQENGSTQFYPGGLTVDAASKTLVSGSTFVDNRGGYANHMYFEGTQSLQLENTVVWSAGTGTALYANPRVALTASHSLVKGLTLAGTGNLGPTTDPRLRRDMRLKSDSPLRGAGSAGRSVFDWDLELRPSASVDIGVDQWVDSADSDSLPDAWEMKTYGSVSFMSGGGDQDSDGLTNAQEYDLETDPIVSDTDHDGVPDGAEIGLGLNPLSADADDLSGDLNHDGVLDSLGVQLGHQPGQLDDDGDSISNADEIAMCLNPLRADSDGDGVPDNLDPFPLDPLMSGLTSNPADVTPPVITLSAPWNAVEQ